MANPTAEKLKDFGLRHGEKVAMGVVALIFATCTYFAWSRPSIDITPEEVKKNAQAANTKINAPAKMPDIIKSLDEAGIKEQGFEKKVDTLQKGLASATKYRLDKPFVSPEPGAGLIRETPELLAPEQLYVHSGRGAIRVVVLDAEGNPKRKDEDTKKAPSGKSTKSKNKGVGGLAGLGGLGGNTKKKSKNTGALAEQEKKKDEEQAEQKKQKSIAGFADVKDDAEQAEEAPALTADQVETALHGQRFATVVGRFDHKKQQEYYTRALKDPSAADPHYVRLEVERRERLPDNSWGNWAPINRTRFEEVDGVLTATEGEVVPPDNRVSNLIDRLPFLEVGYWVGAHHATLVPKSMIKAKVTQDAKPKADEKSKASGMGGQQKNMGMGDYKAKGLAGGAPGGGDYAGGMGGGSGFSPLNLDQKSQQGGGNNASGGDYEKVKGEAIMVRGLDYDVVPDAVYEYRGRIVVANPNLGWVNVSPGVDNKSKELKGPWSLPTAEVGIPADVSTYAVGRTVGSTPAEEKFDFEVVAWNEQDGYTIVHKFDPSPGQIIGSKYNARVPDEKKGEGVTSKMIDFTSHQILADALGGADRPVAEVQPLGVPRVEVPMLALVVRADGVLVVHDHSQDKASGEMAEMKAIYSQIMKDASAPSNKKGTSTLGGAAGAAGGFGGGGGGGGRGGLQGAD